MSEAQSILSEISERQGWTTDSERDLLLSYIENQGSQDAFRDFLEERAAEENGSAA